MSASEIRRLGISIEGGTSYPIVMENLEEVDAVGSEIKFQLPRVIIPSDEKRSREINDVAIGSIRRYVFEYRSRFDDWNSSEAIDNDRVGSYVESSVVVATCNSDFYSMYLPIHNYFRGAAHPNAYFETLTIFVPRARLVTLESIFGEDRSYLEMLRKEAASYIVRELNGEVDAEYVSEQLGHDWVKFEKFTVHEKGMTFYLDEVLAHVYGPQIAELSGTLLQRYLAASPIGERLKMLWGI